MDDKQLTTYLNDHLAGSVMAIDLTETCLEENRQLPLGNFMAVLLDELREDQGTLKELIERLGGSENPAKKMAGWLAEKAGRLKMTGSDFARLRRLEQLETLVVGIRGKLALWVALEEVSRADHRLQGPDFQFLKERAQRQMEQVEAERLRAVRQAFLEDR